MYGGPPKTINFSINNYFNALEDVPLSYSMTVRVANKYINQLLS